MRATRRVSRRSPVGAAAGAEALAGGGATGVLETLAEATAFAGGADRG
jgi:hypothetical protein